MRKGKTLSSAKVQGALGGKVGMLGGYTRDEMEKLVKKHYRGSSWFGSVDRALACGLKGPRFDSSQGHVPRFVGLILSVGHAGGS